MTKPSPNPDATRRTIIRTLSNASRPSTRLGCWSRVEAGECIQRLPPPRANGALRGRPHYPDPAAQGLHSSQELGDAACQTRCPVDDWPTLATPIGYGSHG